MIEDKRHSLCWQIRKLDIKVGTIRIYKCGEKIEYHIYKTVQDGLIYRPDPVLWAIIECEDNHVMKNVKKEFEISGTRYMNQEITKYLNDNPKRVSYNVGF